VEHETSTVDRSAVEALAPRGSFAFEIADATQDGDKLRIKGFANSFRPMRSGRVLLPKPYIKWAKARGRTLPMLAQHGMVTGFASIGRWDSFAYDEKRGALFGGWIGTGTQLQADARSLVQQGALSTLSWGWTNKQSRWVTIDDKDIDADLKTKMEEDDVRECYCFVDYDIVETSLVDVPDDSRSTLASGELMRHIADLHDRIQKMALPPTWDAHFVEELRKLITPICAGGTTDQSAVAAAERVAQATIEKLFPPLQAALLEHMELIALDRDAAYGAALLDADMDPAHEGCAAHGDRSTAGAKRSDDLGALLERVRKM
jgi:phage head maturation protease